MTNLAFPVPDDFLELVVSEVMRRLTDQADDLRREWLTVDEAAAHIGARPQRIYDLRSAGRLPRTGDGSRVLVRRSDLDDYLAGL